ncbi:MAG: anti sigma factor C-terminal domain-containing protein [Marinisporobacter sp.]|nr:anti sigma factor C-terminal domain-containing protein [Marinisporobacter sp.]
MFLNLKDKNDTITKENLKIIGVVVTRDKESLKELKNLKAIKASSFGVIIDKY